MTELAALIFDVDGTLAETEEAHRHAFNAAFAAAGLGWHWDRGLYRHLLATAGGKERIAAYIRDHVPAASLAPAEIAALHADKTRRYGTTMARGGIALRPGIAALIRDARAARLRLAVATTTGRANVEALVAATFGRPASAVFDVIAAGDEVARKKPAGDVYALALARLGLAPEQALALEDSRNGLCAARAAGIACVVAPGPYTRGQDFSGAAAVIDSFADLRLSDGYLAPPPPDRKDEAQRRTPWP